MHGDDLRKRLEAGPLVADGGMGTALIDRGVPSEACLEAVNVDDPEAVARIHRGFVAAGAELILTNTFGANRFRLAAHGRADDAPELIRAGVSIARAAGAPLVAGSIGPLGARLAPYGRIRPESALDAYREAAAALAEAGVDLLMIETQTDLRELEIALDAAREGAPGIAVVACATFTRDDRTPLGSTPEEVAARLVELGVDALGVNCGEGPAQALRVVRRMMPAASDTPLVARPNAGGPASMGGRLVYPATPAYVGGIARALVDEGVSLVGGCCGTGPDHTRAILAALDPSAPSRAVDVEGRVDDVGDVLAASRLGPTELETCLASGRFAVAVELEPPRSFAAATLVAAAQTLREAGADVIDVADAPMAKLRMSAWAACRMIQEAGIETVLHFPTRGRNLLRLQGDLLGAHALGIRDLFVCVGDPVTIGDYPEGSNTVDVTATGVLAMIADGFNRGRDLGGSSIGEPTSFFTGAAVAPNAADLERECRLLVRKVRAGARFLLSQPVYDAEALTRLFEVYEGIAGEPLTTPILAGVLPLVSARHAEFLHNEVPGIVIPEAIRDRLDRAGDEGWRTGLDLAGDLVGSLRAAGAAGVYVIPQMGRFDLAADVVERARGQSG